MKSARGRRATEQTVLDGELAHRAHQIQDALDAMMPLVGSAITSLYWTVTDDNGTVYRLEATKLADHAP